MLMEENDSRENDYGDDWVFVIHVQKVSKEAAFLGKYEVIKGKGGLEQYPDWDDDVMKENGFFGTKLQHIQDQVFLPLFSLLAGVKFLGRKGREIEVLYNM